MSKLKLDSFAQIIIYLLGLLLLIKAIIFPILNPISTAANINYLNTNLFQQVLNKSNAFVDVTMQRDEDEDREELFPLVFKYLTDIDISNPKTYIAAQIPILSLIDVTSIVNNGDEPAVITPSQNEGAPNNNAEGQKPEENNDFTPLKLNPDKPLILIYHTHTREIYNPGNTYGSDFSTDFNLGIVKVGEEIKKELESKYGIATIHDTRVHDLPTRTGSYGRSRPTVEEYIKKYPSLKIIIDLHRDGGVSSKSRTAIINNEQYARTMFVVGANNRNKELNTNLSQKLNDTFERLYKGFSRGIVYKNAVYNQDLSANCVLIEVGSDENTLQEALNSAKIISRVLYENVK
ncbi:stage II sporulation protein P [Fonticella tunisiensis]|uniref:Stage II sporulation protein P n=1 Tax=Fonticella tunisiensis TaxID=1096341 RepID=A0A4R7KB20_9CLOT|nr:stage II sporulation protein P [Fonticella tunisiensis]TDT51112.1 stage II sporulation protein P [Fonticella tunisiensis]